MYIYTYLYTSDVVASHDFGDDFAELRCLENSLLSVLLCYANPLKSDKTEVINSGYKTKAVLLSIPECDGCKVFHRITIVYKDSIFPQQEERG